MEDDHIVRGVLNLTWEIPKDVFAYYVDVQLYVRPDEDVKASFFHFRNELFK